VEGSAPSIVLVGAVDILLLFSEHEPVENHHNHVADDGHGVEEMMLGLIVNSFLRCQKGVLSEVNGVLRCTNTGPEGKSGEHQGPIGERN